MQSILLCNFFFLHSHSFLFNLSFESSQLGILIYLESKEAKRLCIHSWENEAFKGVEFTEISCRRCELGSSRFDGMTSRCKGLRATVSCENEGRKFGSVCQHSQIILATRGSSSLGISRRRFWKPTAPTTCIGFMPLQGNFRVASSHKMTPKLNTSHFSFEFSLRRTSGDIHSG